MTEKPGVAYPPLSDEDLAEYCGPPELGYLPFVNIANELVKARAALKADAINPDTKVASGLAPASWADATRHLGERVAKLEATHQIARRIRTSKYIRDLEARMGGNDWLRADAELIEAIFARVDVADRLEAEIGAVEAIVSTEKLGDAVMLADGSLRERVADAITRAEQNGRTEGKRESHAVAAKLQLVREAVGATLQPDGTDDVVERARAMQTELGQAKANADAAREALWAANAKYDELSRKITEALGMR